MNGENKADISKEEKKENEDPVPEKNFEDLTEEEKQQLIEEYYPEEREEVKENDEDDDFVANIFRKAKDKQLTPEQLQVCDPRSFNISKLGDRIRKQKKDKKDEICPFFGYHYPCPELLYKDFCPY